MQNEKSSQAKDKGISEELLADIEQRFDTEAIAQMVEQMSFSKNLSQNLTKTFGQLNRGVAQSHRLLHLTQEELRNLALDVELLKRAATSLGQIGVMERKKIERELILQLFPPSQSRAGVGVRVDPILPLKPAKIDCASRMHICRAACCRTLTIYLNAEELESGSYEWNPREPYALIKNRYGCIYLSEGGCGCTRHKGPRPNICPNYSCIKDRRIWADFEKKTLNPNLEKRMKKLGVDTFSYQSDVTANSTEPVVDSIDDDNKRPVVDSNSEADSIEPPDFSELRDAMIPEPANKFIPPKASETDEGPAETFDEPEENSMS